MFVFLFTASDYLFVNFKLLFVLLPFFFCHCIVCPSIYGFWLPLWYLQASLCPFALFILSLYCLSFFYLRLLITCCIPLSFSLSFCPFHFVIVLSVLLLFMASDYLFGTFKLLFVPLLFFFCHCIVCPSSIYCFRLPLLYLQASLCPFFFCHCIVCRSSIDGFWLPLWYLQASLCPFALFLLSLYCLSFFYLQLLITFLVPSSFSLSFCPFSFVIVLSVLLFTASDYLFGTFKLLFVLLPFSFCHCIVCPSSIYGFWLPLWYLQASLCPFGLFLLSLYCLSFFYLRLLITSLVSSSFSLSFCPFHFVIVLSVLLFTASDYLFGIFKLLFVLLPFFFCHCIVCPSIYGFWLPLWYLQASLCPFALFILSLYCLSFFYLRFWLPLWYLQASLCPFTLFLLSLYCLSVFYLLLLITSFVPSSFSLSFCLFSFVIVLSVVLQLTVSDYLFCIFKLLFVLVSFFFFHCIVCLSSIYSFWLPLWYLQASLCPFALFLSLYCLSFFYLRLLITSLESSSLSLSFCPFHFVIVLSVLLFTASDYLFGTFKLLFVLLPFFFCHCIVCPSIYASDYLFGIFKPLFVLLPFSVCHCIVCPSPIYVFWLPLWYLQASLCPFALFILSLYCMSFFYLRLLNTSLVPSSFSLSFCPFHFVIVFSVLLLFTAFDYLFGTFKLPFVALPFFFCHCIVCPSSIYGFWLPLWYLQASLCPFAFFLLSLYCLSFFYLRLLITSLVSSSFFLSFCPFHFVIVLSVLLLFTASDYLFGIFKLLFVLLPFFFCHCIVCPSIYGFWLPLWYLQASVCPFALFLLSLYCLSFYLRLLITSLVSTSLSLSFFPFHFVIVLSVLLLFTASDYLLYTFKLLFVLLPFSFCHCIVCPSSIYGFWLPLWYLQASLCPFALFLLSLYCLFFFYLPLLITFLVPLRFSLPFALFRLSLYCLSFYLLLLNTSSVSSSFSLSFCPFSFSLYCLSFYLRLLITSLVSSSLSLSFWPFQFVILLSVLLLFTASDYLFGTFKLLFVLLPFSFCHCIVCPSPIYGFWLPLWYLQASLCPFALFILSLYCLSFYLRLLITSLVSSSLSLSFCAFHFVFVLYVLLLFTASDYLFCTFKLLFVLLPFSFCYCIVCPSPIYGFWLPLWYLQAALCPFALFLLSLYCLSFYLRLLITSLLTSSFSLSFCPFSFVIVLSVLLFTASDYLFGIFKPLFVLLPFSVCHCIVSPSPIYGFWLPLWYLQASLCPFALFLLSLYCLSFYLRLLITSLVSTSLSLSFFPFHFVIVLSLLLFTASDYLLYTFKLLFVLLPFSFCHCIVCPSSIYGFWLPLWYLQASLCPFALFLLSLYCLSVFYLLLLLTSFVPSSFSLSFFLLSLYCLSFFYWRFLITSLVSSSFSLSFCPFSFVIVLSVRLLFTASDYLFGTFKLLFVILPFFFCHCNVCPSIYGFWLPLWYLQASLCPFALFILSLYFLSFFYLRLLITSLVPSSFRLSLCPFSFVIVLSVLLLFTASDYLFGTFKLLFVLLPFFFCHCIVCPSSIYGFWLPLWYLQASFCPFALFILSLYCLSFSYLRLLITSLVSSSFSLSFCPFSFVIVLSVLLFTASDYLFGTFKLLFVPLPFFFCHCIVCPSIYAFWLPLWYLQASLCPFSLFILSLYCLSFFYLRLLITSCIPSSFSLSFCPFHFVIVLSVLLLFMASDYLFGTFKLLFVLLPFFFCHCIVCSFSIYRFWLPFWYL